MITLVGIFLALGLGMLFGGSFIDQSVVDTLRLQQRSLSANNDRLHDRLLSIEKELKARTKYEDASRSLVVEGSLAGRNVILITFDSTSDGAKESVAQILAEAEASVSGAVELSSKLDLATTERKQQAALAVEADPSADVAPMVLDRLTGSLAGTSPGFIQRLIDVGLASPGDLTGFTLKPATSIADAGSAIIFVAPEEKTKTLTEKFLLPLVQRLAAANVVAAVVERGSSELQVLGPIRGDAGLRVVTVDSIETTPGQVALAYGVRAAFEGTFGHWGLGSDATAVLPPTTGG